MTKLIAALAILAALAWAVTATASWISTKKAPLAISAGRVSHHASTAEQDKAMLRAQMRIFTSIAFATVMFAALFRVSIGLSGQAALPLSLTAGLSASGGLLLYSALPATALPATSRPATLRSAKSPTTPRKRAFVLPAACLLALAAFVTVNGLAASTALPWHNSSPLLLAALAVAASALLALRRLSTTASLPDPRMASMDRRWRTASANNLLNFTSGTLLAYLGVTVLTAGLALLGGASTSDPAHPMHIWGIIWAAGGAVAALAGLVLVAAAAKGTLTLRATTRQETPSPVNT